MICCHAPFIGYQSTPKTMPQTADYSLLIAHPSPDLQNNLEWMQGREVFKSQIALRDLTQLQPMGFVNGLPILPVHVIKFIQEAVARGSYRVELLDGETEYKLYRKLRDDDKQSS